MLSTIVPFTKKGNFYYFLCIETIIETVDRKKRHMSWDRGGQVVQTIT